MVIFFSHFRLNMYSLQEDSPDETDPDLKEADTQPPKQLFLSEQHDEMIVSGELRGYQWSTVSGGL